MPATVLLFVTCLIDTLYPHTGEAVVQVLRRAGLTLEFPPGQTCCGQPAFNAGLRVQARQMAIHTLEVFGKTSGPIIIPSGSCAAMLRHGYLELFAEDSRWLPRAREIAQRVFELSEFLVDILHTTDLGAEFHGRLTYHASCHLSRGLGIHHQPLTLLQSVRRAELVELPEADECCGFGGVFSVEHPELSGAMLGRKLTNLNKTGADQLVTCDAGCLTHINGGLKRLGKNPCAVHLADILVRQTGTSHEY